MENSSTSKRSQLSPELWPAEAFYIPYTLAAIVGFALIGVVTAIVLIAVGLPLLHIRLNHLDMAHLSPRQTTIFFTLQDLIYVPMIALIIYLTPKLGRRTLAQIGLAKPRPRDLRNGVVAAVATWIVVAVVSTLWDVLTKKQHHQNELSLFSNLNFWQSIISAVTAIVVAPFAEELVFRFFLLNALLRYAQSLVDTFARVAMRGAGSDRGRRLTAAAFAIVVDGVAFGFAHGQLDVVPALGACGIVLALAYYRTGSLWTNVVAHGLFNGVTTVALLVFHFGG